MKMTGILVSRLTTPITNYLRVKGVIEEGYNPHRDTYEVTFKLGSFMLTHVTIEPSRLLSAPSTQVEFIPPSKPSKGAMDGYPYPWKLTDFRTGSTIGRYPNAKVLAKELAELREKLQRPLVIHHQPTDTALVRMPMSVWPRPELDTLTEDVLATVNRLVA